MNVIPRRSLNQPLDWKYKGQFQCVLSGIDIDMLVKHHGETSVTIVECDDENKHMHIEFEGKIHSKKLFTHLRKFKDLKQKQDRLKADNDPEYNPALRELSKLYLNSFTGKLNE